MALSLRPEEPPAGPWRVERLDSFLRRLLPDALPHRARLLAVDGRSASGKSTLAARVAGHWATAEVVHTDDIAWEHSRFGWSGLLIDGVLTPLHRGESVSYRPPAWQRHDRAGAVEVRGDAGLVVIEGVGCGRAELAPFYDAVLWVQSDVEETARRDRARVGTPSGPRSVQFVRDWMAEEVPFLAAHRPWENADAVVCGTPMTPHDTRFEVVTAPRFTPGRVEYS